MKLAKFFEKFDQFADAPNLVGKMRELVLELAVNGRLVPQDSTDEPAEALLKRVHADDNRVTKRRSVRRKDTAAEVVAPHSVPSSWTWTSLGSIADWGSGSTPPRGNHELYGGSITWLKSGELNDNRTLIGSEEQVTELALKRGSFRLNQPGDVLFAMYGATVGKAAILAEPAVTNQAVCGCTPCVGVLNRYLFLYLVSQRQRFRNASEGGAQPNFSKDKIVSYPFPLPPLAEQMRIVAKVDELMALCDRLEAQQHERQTRHAALARASLARFAAAPTPANLQYLFHPSYDITPADLRKTILTLAVQGKLVAQDPNDELSDLIPEIVPSSPPLDVPDSWRWTEFGEIGEISGGFAFKSGDYTPSGVFILRVTNIAPSGEISKDEAVFLPPDKVTREIERFYLNEGDILLVMVGGSLGKIGLVTSDVLPALLNQNLWRITPVNGEVDKQFLRLITDFSVSFQRQVTHSTHGHLSREEFRRKAASVPPLAEQRRIVAKVEQLMALVDTLETQLAASHATAAKLLDALVAELTGCAKSQPAPAAPATTRRGRPRKT